MAGALAWLGGLDRVTKATTFPEISYFWLRMFDETEGYAEILYQISVSWATTWATAWANQFIPAGPGVWWSPSGNNQQGWGIYQSARNGHIQVGQLWVIAGFSSKPIFFDFQRGMFGPKMI